MEFVVGVDVGGTFTDLVCIDKEGNVTVVKTSSTPSDPSIAVIDALTKVAGKLKGSLEEFLPDVLRICHGTTVSTNTILTWTGAKTGLVTTKGFKDTLEIREGRRENQYNYAIPAPKPLVPRYLRIGIEGRVKWNGEVVTPLNEDEVQKAATYLKEQGIEALAICFLWSFRNPAHEKRAAEICRENLPDAYVCASCDISPEIREYWRTSTTVLNAYVGPVLSKYIKHLVKTLKEFGYTRELLITQSNAGVISPEIAMEQAVRTVLSGPACAPAAGIFLCQPYNLDNLITIDIGGTSFDVTLIKEGKPWMASEVAVADVYHIRLPLIDVHTIGAGGGSIAWLDDKGALHVGPQSAAADPGPACYDKGGKEPTCTDADLVLGYLNPNFFLGGEIKLNPELSRKAIKERIADPLRMDVVEAARSIVKIIDHNMVDGISAVSVRRGEDPRKYVMVAAGGAGPMHAASLAKSLGIGRIMIPSNSSVFCALGSIISDIRHDFVRTIVARTNTVDYDMLNDAYRDMERVANETLDRERISVEDRYFNRAMDMRYKGQFHEVEVPVPEGTLNSKKMDKVVQEFHQKHEALYAYRDVVETEIINLRLVASGRVVKPARKEQAFESADASQHLKGKRDVFFEESRGFVSTSIYDGDAMRYGNIVEGPAIIEQRVTTIVVPPGARLEVAKYGDYIMDLPVQEGD